MNSQTKENLVSFGGILGSLIVALAIGFAGSQGGSVVEGVPVFLLCGVFAFLIQWLMFFPAFIFQTEKYFDVTGSLTYISLALFAIYLSGANEPGVILIGLMVMIWAVRLGTFLFLRISADGQDRRFKSIKPDFFRFLMTWTVQGLWVLVTFSAGLAAMTSGKPFPFDVFLGLGIVIWLVGFSIEVIADQQKRTFKKHPDNSDKFITHGLWAWSRHPNYFGEIMLWTGIAVAASPMLSGWQYITLISPIFVFVLLTYISGVRMLEARSNRRWGDDVGYQSYCNRTPRLVIKPWLSSE